MRKQMVKIFVAALGAAVLLVFLNSAYIKPAPPAATTRISPTPAASPIPVYEDVIASVDPTAVVGDGRYYTADGAPIITPSRSTHPSGIVRRTVTADQRVLYPEDGIRVIGKMSLDDFRDVLVTIARQTSAREPQRIKHTNQAGDTVATRTLSEMNRNVLPGLVQCITVRTQGSLSISRITRPPIPTPDNPHGHGAGDELLLTKEQGNWVIRHGPIWIR